MAAMIFFYIQQEIPLIACMLKIYNHTSFKDHKLSGNNVVLPQKY